MGKYSLQKRLVLLGTTIGLSAAVLSTKYTRTITNNDVEYTQEDDINNQLLKNQLYNLSIVEDSEEVYLPIDSKLRKTIASKNHKSIDEPITMEDLRSIKELEIDEMTKEEYNCLFYFENLEVLKISNSTVNLKVLENNINLTKLILDNVYFNNSKCIPNSVSSIKLLSSTCFDDEFRVPYNVSNIDIVMSFVNNLSLKNPERLKSFNYYSESLFDIKALKDCSLDILNIICSGNIKNVDYLPNIRCGKLFLDDSASIWLTHDIYKQIENNVKFFDRPFYLESNIVKLDELGDNLKSISDNTTVEEIEKYILDSLEYDEAIYNDSVLPKYYNAFPIMSIMNSDKGICVNYASLFQALANRCGIESYLISNDDHAWNKIIIDGKEINVDTTFMDESDEDKEYYDDFILDDSHIAKNEPVIEYMKDNDIGYVPKEYKYSFVADKYIDFTSLQILITEYQDKILLALFAYMTYNIIEIKRNRKRKKRINKRRNSLH